MEKFITIEFTKSEFKTDSVYICFHGYNSLWNEKDIQFFQNLNKYNDIFKIYYSNDIHKLNFIDVCDYILKALMELKINESNKFKKINILGHSFGGLFALKLCTLFTDKTNTQFKLILLDPVIIDDFYKEWLRESDKSDKSHKSDKSDKFTEINSHKSDKSTEINSHKIEKLNNIQNYITLEQFMKSKGFSKIIVQVYLSIQNNLNIHPDRLKKYTSLCSTNINSFTQIYNCSHMIHRDRCVHLCQSLK